MRFSRRPGVLFFLAGVLAAWGAERWVVTGILVPVRVVSGSMAPRLKGPHGQTLCEDCHSPFAWDAASSSRADSTVVCPNCGANTLTESTAWQRGQRVLIWRGGYRPRRWDTVVVQLPRNSDTGDHVPPDAARQSEDDARDHWAVKRIVGLPGEQIALRSGDVWIGHQRLRKDWSTQRRLSLLVHDDSYRTSHSTAVCLERWGGDPRATHWEATPKGYRWRSPISVELESKRSGDWLIYRHRACFDSPLFRRSELPLQDHYGYNQSLSRPLHEVSDLFVKFRCRLQGPRRSPDAALQIRLHDGQGELHLQWNVDGNVQVTHEDDFRWTTSLPPLPTDRPFHVIAGIWDGQVVLVVDDLERLRIDYSPISRSSKPSSRPIAISAVGWRQADLTDVSVWRDTYYTHPNDLEIDWSLAAPLGPDEYLLLGDNSPASLDGRHGPRHGVVNRKRIIGRVIPVAPRPVR